MSRIASLFAVVLLASACASARQDRGVAAPAPLAPVAKHTSPASQEVELRHFYLLSPGPGAKLVITRREVAAGETAPAEATPAVGLQ